MARAEQDMERQKADFKAYRALGESRVPDIPIPVM